MSALTPTTNFAEPAERLLAALIDFGIILGAAIVIGVIGIVVNLIPILGQIISLLLFIGLFVVANGYPIFLTSMPNSLTQKGQTLGKKYRKIKIVKADGSDFTVGDAFMRFVVGGLICTVTLGIGLLLILFDEKKQGLHDKIANTYVVKAE